MTAIQIAHHAPRTLAKPTDLDAAFAAFLRLDVAAGDASPDTVRAYRSGLRRFADFCTTHDVEPRDVTADDVREYRRDLIEAGHKAATVAARLAAVRRFYDAATWAGIRLDNPATGIKPPRERRADDAGGFLSEGDLRVLLHETPGDDLPGKRDRAILGLMAIHGLRTVEVHRANVGDLERTGDAPVLRVRGKTRERTVYLRADTERAVRHYVAGRADLTDMLKPEVPLMVSHGNRGGGQRLSRRGVRRIVDAALARARIKRPGLSAHALRHTAATLSLANGAELGQVQAMLGHTSPTTTAIYAHAIQRAERNPALAIPVEV